MIQVSDSQALDEDFDDDDNDQPQAISAGAIGGEDKASTPSETLEAIKADDLRLSLAQLSRLGLAGDLTNTGRYMIINLPSKRRGTQDAVTSSLYAGDGGNMEEKFGLLPAHDHRRSGGESIENSLWEIKSLGEVSIHYSITNVSSGRHLTVTSEGKLCATTATGSKSKKGSPSKKGVVNPLQRWQLEKLGLGSFMIMHSATERLLCTITSSGGHQVALSSAPNEAHKGENPKWRILEAAEVNWTTQWGETLLHRAAWKGLVDVVEALLARPDFTMVSEQNQWGETALHGAVMHAHSEVCDVLLNSGLQLDLADQNGWTVLDVLETHASLRPQAYEAVIQVFQKYGIVPGGTMHPSTLSNSNLLPLAGTNPLSLPLSL